MEHHSDDSRVVIYDRNMFINEATGHTDVLFSTVIRSIMKVESSGEVSVVASGNVAYEWSGSVVRKLSEENLVGPMLYNFFLPNVCR